MSIDIMIKDSLVLSDKYFNFLEAIHDPEEYLKLDDNIINTIQNFNTDDMDLQKAKDIIIRVKNRDIYKFIGEISINEIDLETEYNNFLSIDNPGNVVNRDDIELNVFSIDYGFGSNDPFKHTFFYKSNESKTYMTLSPGKLSLIAPNVYKENYLRVYCKDLTKVEEVNQIFEKYIKRRKHNSSDLTPIKIKSSFLSNKRERESELDQIN